ncbi:MAG: hypothetical protein O7B99_01180, partial [Planctomycetota bacterium]|nr:hypothetical protein [Planctomycetota bacterium]
PVLLGAALAAGFVDQLAVYTGSIPGGQGLSLADWLAPERLEQPLHREAGDDAILEAFFLTRA